MTLSWEDLAAGAQRHRDETIAKVAPAVPDPPKDLPYNVTDIPRKLLTAREVEITETSVDSLVKALGAGEISSTEATNAFLRRAGLAQKLVNCVLELMPEAALARAKELDDLLAKTKKPVGPLHGLPISVKGRVAMKGLASSEGIVANLATLGADDANIVKIFRSLGAIPYVRTTEPQGLMMLENISNISGSTTNPHNTRLTPGGSSGGESALLSLWGSPLGIGSDIGGSVRSPAANCGIYSLKPTVGRLPSFGTTAYNSGCETILGTLGPMCPTLGGLEIFMKTVLDTEPWKSDPTIHQYPWRNRRGTFTPTLNIGVMWDDGVVKPSQSVTRALKEVVSKLEARPEFKVTRWEPFNHQQGVEILEKLYAPDGGEAFQRALARSGEPLLDLTRYRLVEGPGVEKLSIQGVWDWTRARELFRYQYLQEWINKAPDMHVILCPAFPGPAPAIGTSKYWGYTSIWNLLDYPGTVFPVSKVDAKVDIEPKRDDIRSTVDEWTSQHFDPELQDGAPLCLQLIGKKLDDETVLAATEQICSAIGLPFVDTLK